MASGSRFVELVTVDPTTILEWSKQVLDQDEESQPKTQLRTISELDWDFTEISPVVWREVDRILADPRNSYSTWEIVDYNTVIVR